MNIKGDKRGSHVGIIASFSIFILFLIGIYAATQPLFSTQKENDLLIQYLETEIMELVSGNLTIAIVESTGNCIEVANDRVGVSERGAIVKDPAGNFVYSEYNGKLMISPNSYSVLWISYSPEFPVITGSSSGCDVPYIESVRRSKEIFETRVVSAVNSFDAWKDTLNIPPGRVFSFFFQYYNGTVISAGEQEIEREVYADELPVEYVDKNANKLYGKFGVKVW